jgi:aminotransferase
MQDLQLAARMRAIAQSDIRRMTLECDRMGGVNLGQGVCDLPTLPLLVEGAADALAAHRSTYSRYDGIAELRHPIARRLREKNNVEYAEDGEIVVTAGSTGAFAMAMMAFLDPGDEVILPEPFYGYHWNTILAAGGVPKPVPLIEPDFALDPDALENAVGARTRMIVVCTPANPCGKVWTERELDAVTALIRKHDLWAITDEIYEDILYDGRPHVSLASRPGARERTITVSGFSKTFSITGWRLGFAAAPERVAHAIGILNDLFYVCAPTPLQHAVAHALTRVEPSYFEELRRDYTDKRDLLVSVADELGWAPRRPAGAYYLLVEPHVPGRNAREKADYILRQSGVAGVPGSAFFSDGGGEHLLRFSFAKTEGDLNEAARRLRGAFLAVKETG